jgi:hypothetical protein
MHFVLRIYKAICPSRRIEAHAAHGHAAKAQAVVKAAGAPILMSAASGSRNRALTA